MHPVLSTESLAAQPAHMPVLSGCIHPLRVDLTAAGSQGLADLRSRFRHDSGNLHQQCQSHGLPVGIGFPLGFHGVHSVLQDTSGGNPSGLGWELPSHLDHIHRALSDDDVDIQQRALYQTGRLACHSSRLDAIGFLFSSTSHLWTGSLQGIQWQLSPDIRPHRP